MGFSGEQLTLFSQQHVVRGTEKAFFSQINIGDYDYVVIIDADFSITRGSLDSFEKKLHLFRPAIAVPVVDKNSTAYTKCIGRYQYGLVFYTDEQFQAIETRVLNSLFKCNPYVSRYDELPWWYPCVIIQAFITRFLWLSSLVDIEFEISNSHEGGYSQKWFPKF